MATFWEIDVDHDGRGAEISWREETQADWTVIGERPGRRFRVSVPATVRFFLRARPVDKDGHVDATAQKIIVCDPMDRVTDRPEPSALSVPDPEVVQEGAAFVIVLKPPAGQRPEEYRWECRHSVDAIAPEDAKQVGILEFGETAREDVWSGVGAQKIHARVIRKADGVAGAWVSSVLTPKNATEADTEDHLAGFGSGTLVPICEDGPAALEIASSKLRLRADLAREDLGDASREQLETAGTTRAMLRGTPSQGIYRTPTIVLPETQAFALEVRATAATITRPSPSRDDIRHFTRRIPELTSLDEPLDNEVDRMSYARDFAREPVRAEISVAVSDSDSPTFDADDFKPHVPGKVQFVRSYAVELKVRSLLGLVVEFSNLRIRREVVCRRCDARLVQIRKVKAAHTLVRGKPVYINGSGDYTLAKADAAGTIAVGIVSLVESASAFFVATSGVMRWASHGLTLGTRYYLDAVTAGAITTTRPTGGNFAQSILVPLTADEVLVHIGQGELTA